MSILIDDLVNEEVDNAVTQNATKRRSGEERDSDSEEEWMNIMVGNSSNRDKLTKQVQLKAARAVPKKVVRG